MEDPSLEVELELHLPTYTIVTATRDPSHICNTTAHSKARSSNPLGEARDGTPILVDTSQILNPLNHNGSFPISGI